MKKTIAMLGLTSEQRELLKQLSKQRVSFLQTMAKAFSDDEDYSQANMMNRAFGTEVLRQQVESEKKEKEEKKELIDECRKAGISEWRINAVL